MTNVEFNTIIEQIQQYYNAEYNEVQLSKIYNFFQGIPLHQLSYVVDKAYERCRRLPMLADLSEINKEVPKGFTVKTTGKKDCKYCGGRGYFLYTKYDKENEQTYKYLAHCNCEASLDYMHDGQKVKDEKLRSNYYIPYIADIVKQEGVKITFPERR